MRRIAMLIGVAALPLAAGDAAAQLGRDGAATSAAPAVITPGLAPRSAPVSAGTSTPPETGGAAPVDQVAPDPSPAPPAAALAPDRAEDTTVRTWALQAAYAVFYFLSATVMVVAGVGLAIPVLGGFGLLLSLAFTGLGGGFRRRAG